MWLGTDLVFDAFKFYICETPYGVMQVHGYPYDATDSTFIVEMHDDVWRARRLRASARAHLPARGQRRAVDRPDPRAARRRPRRARGAGQQLQVAELPDRHQRAPGATATSSCSATPRTPRTSRSARARSWRWRTRWRWPPACTSSPDVPTALAAYEAERRPVVLSTQRAAQASLEWFESIGQYVGQAARAVRVQHRDPQPADHLRQPASCATRSSWPGWTRWFAGTSRRAAGRGAAADVPAVPARRGSS